MKRSSKNKNISRNEYDGKYFYKGKLMRVYGRIKEDGMEKEVNLTNMEFDITTDEPDYLLEKNVELENYNKSRSYITTNERKGKVYVDKEAWLHLLDFNKHIHEKVNKEVQELRKENSKMKNMIMLLQLKKPL